VDSVVSSIHSLRTPFGENSIKNQVVVPPGTSPLNARFRSRVRVTVKSTDQVIQPPVPTERVISTTVKDRFKLSIIDKSPEPPKPPAPVLKYVFC
jgi:hypothetical protein